MKKMILAIFCLSIFVVQAQENLNKEVIDVVKDFRPKVMQANKIKSQPVFIDTTKVSENLKYKIRFEEFRVQQQIDSLYALVMERPSLEKLFTKYVELGLGSLLNPHLVVDISNGRSTKNMYHAYLNYDGAFSKNLSVDDTYSNLLLGAEYKCVFEKHVLESDLGVNDVYRFDTLDNSLQNTLLSFNSGLQFIDSSSVFIPKAINVSANLFFQGLKFTERKIALQIEHKGIHEKLKDWSLNNSAVFQMSNDFNYVHWKTKVKSHKKLDLADVQIAFKFDVLEGDVKFIPELRAQYQLIEKGLYAYVQLGGDRELYSLSELYIHNPYLQAIGSEQNNWVENIPSNTKYFGSVGLNGNLFRGVSYQVSVAASTQDNFMHFVNFTNAYEGLDPWIAPEYTDLKSLQFHAEIDAKWTDKFHLWLKGDYRSPDKHLSYVPELELGLYGAYHYNDQWFISSSVRYLGEREALSFSENLYSYVEEVDALPAIMDVNMKVNFAYNKQLDFYFEGLNLLNQNFIFWQQNPVLGRQVNFGAKYRF